MEKRLFLLDGMALVYRAHFALVRRPILTAAGLNTSAIYGFTQTLLDIQNSQKPTHIAVAFDTAEPTQRHREFPAYKIQREAMPEELESALPQVERILRAFRIPVLICPGYEADDIIGTLVKRAEVEGFESFMVTPDKDFAQLVNEHTRIYKPGRMGDPPQIQGVTEIRERWGIERPEQVIDILGLMGDTSDNIPGVPGIGPKTASKLIAQFESLEQLLISTDQLKGKQRTSLEQFRDQAILSKRLATIDCNVPIEATPESLSLHSPDEDALRSLFIEFEFNSLGKRLFGPSFRAGRGTLRQREPAVDPAAASSPDVISVSGLELRTLGDTNHHYESITTEAAGRAMLKTLRQGQVISVAADLTARPGELAHLRGLALCNEPGRAFYLALSSGDTAPIPEALFQELQHLLEDDSLVKVGHDLKPLLAACAQHKIHVRGPLFDVALAHALAEPDLRHQLSFQAESLLGYALAGKTSKPSPQIELELTEPDLAERSTQTMEAADIALQLKPFLAAQLKSKAQEKLFFDIEMPLVPVIAAMECEGIRVDTEALKAFSDLLGEEMETQQRRVFALAGQEFNLNSAKQLGDVLFDQLKLLVKPKKTRTGQYATDEQTLVGLAGDHEIVRHLLAYRTCSKLKSTYADALPTAINPVTGRIHTTFHQLATATGRLTSQNPNLQNIPIRTRLGQEIRRAFVARSPDHLLLSADYSQIELRIIASLSEEVTLMKALREGADVHTATAARVYGVPPEEVNPEMRKKAKMVNYGIAYGISTFGLSQRLHIPRQEAADIIEQYFLQFPALKGYMDRTIQFARDHGYVETLLGRRRYLRDINSSNGTIRSAAERNGINAPIQGTAADMIKLAMIRIHEQLRQRNLRSKLLLQVHDELVFDVPKAEKEELAQVVEKEMAEAIPLKVPVEVDLGFGDTWLEAH